MKLVHFGSAAFPPLLFDLKTDPGETVNVAGDPSYAVALVECMAEMLRWRARHAEHSLTHLNIGEGGAM